MTIDANERTLLAGLANELIPAGKGFPSASEAGVATEGLNQVLSVRPDMVDRLKAILAEAKNQEPAKAVSNLKANDPDGFEVLAELVPAAYFLNPNVRTALGYGGQTPHPIDPKPDYLDDGLLQSVIDRGPIYRPTPKV